MALAPDGFDVPIRLETESFVLEPLGPQHNERDYEAWSSSIDHIRATVGFVGGRWPYEMSLAENLADLERHRAEFDERAAFAYTVLDSHTDDVIGCVYVDPDPEQPGGVTVRSWVRVSHASRDEQLRSGVVDWLEHDWPFASVAVPGLDG